MTYQEAMNLVNNQLMSLNRMKIKNCAYAPSVNGCGFGVSGTFDEWAVKREKKNIFNRDGIYEIEHSVLKWRKGAKGVPGDSFWKLMFKGNFEQVVEFLVENNTGGE